MLFSCGGGDHAVSRFRYGIVLTLQTLYRTSIGEGVDAEDVQYLVD
jgi:hypothetical protein